MATYHLSVKFGGKGQAANHADYIERKGEYAKRKDLETNTYSRCISRIISWCPFSDSQHCQRPSGVNNPSPWYYGG